MESGGVVLLLWLMGLLGRFAGAVSTLGFERMLEEFFLLGSAAVMISLGFGKIWLSGGMLLGLLLLFFLHVPALISAAGVIMYSATGLALGLFPLLLSRGVSTSTWLIAGGGMGLATVSEVWVSGVVLAIAGAAESAGRPMAAYRCWRNLARGWRGTRSEPAYARRAGLLARRLGRSAEAGEFLSRAGLWADAGDAWLDAARQAPAAPPQRAVKPPPDWTATGPGR